MVECNLKKLLEDLEVEKVLGDLPEEITGLHYHSGHIKEGNLFVAIPGEKVDGHAYIKDAMARGARVVLGSQKTDLPIAQILVKDPRRALAKISASYFNHPSEKFTLVGITATNGKTSTAFLLNHILQKAGQKTGLIGTVKVAYPSFSEASILTTPQSYDLQKHFYHMAQAGIDTCVMEVSSSAQELERVVACDFDLVSFHNLSREHIDQHGSFENYYRQKKKLVTEAKEEALVLLNEDENLLKKLKEETQGQVLNLSFEGDSEADILYKDLDLSTGLGAYKYQLKKDFSFQGREIHPVEFKIHLASPGYSSVMNSLVAATEALALGIDPKTIQEALGSFKGVERRFEKVVSEPFIVLDDHFANVKNIETTMSTLKAMDFKDLVMAYAIRGNRGVHLNEETSQRMASLLKDLPLKGLFVSLSRDVTGEKDQVSEEEREVFIETMEAAGISFKLYDTLKETVKEALELVEEGDVLLLAGCQGMDKGAKILLDLKDGRIDQKALSQQIENRSC